MVWRVVSGRGGGGGGGFSSVTRLGCFLLGKSCCVLLDENTR